MKSLILIIQIADIALHIISNQAEILRILANLIIIAWVFKFYNGNSKNINWTILGIYLIFNFSFQMIHLKCFKTKLENLKSKILFKLPLP